MGNISRKSSNIYNVLKAILSIIIFSFIMLSCGFISCVTPHCSYDGVQITIDKMLGIAYQFNENEFDYEAFQDNITAEITFIYNNEVSISSQIKSSSISNNEIHFSLLPKTPSEWRYSYDKLQWDEWWPFTIKMDICFNSMHMKNIDNASYSLDGEFKLSKKSSKVDMEIKILTEEPHISIHGRSTHNQEITLWNNWHLVFKVIARYSCAD